MDELIKRHSEIMSRRDPEGKIGLIVDEWGCWYDVEEGTNPGFLYQQNTMRDAIVAACNLNIFNNHSDKVVMANLAQAELRKSLLQRLITFFQILQVYLKALFCHFRTVLFWCDLIAVIKIIIVPYFIVKYPALNVLIIFSCYITADMSVIIYRAIRYSDSEDAVLY